ncbi:glutamate--tRNA ligase [Ruminococcaceae bacterium OttesenSCG-928-I18]|nr:glutamate--tRNA ligase [Ruminococcaceae bacterium OttesenSCG-928-I18]
MNAEKLAGLLFPQVAETVDDLEKQYPTRTLPEGAKVTRMGPSPTGFMHLGNLYGAIADERLAHQSGGVFFLRIEDTDQKREVEGGVKTILSAFREYGLPFDEGATEEGESGVYGPYYQRRREEIYHICAKQLVLQGKAYPCFLTEEELAGIREEQAAKKLDFGCYGEFARYRDCAYEELEKRVADGEPWVLRYRSEGNAQNHIKTTDLIRGTLELPENIQDVVLLKKDGIPTYHFAHVVDDHLMRTTHVVRGEEWLATLPIHLQLFSAMGWKQPKYLHTAHLMKQDGAGKRKLSKRKDPELSLSFYHEKGYSPAAVKEYLMTLLNSNFEEWRTANPDASMDDFPFSIKKMSVSGALFDIQKLDDTSRNVVGRMSAEEVYVQLTDWAGEYDPDFAALLRRDKDYTLAALTVGRNGPKRRKDITAWSDAKEYLRFYFDELFQPDYTLPERVTPAKAKEILEGYEFLPGEDASLWFERVKALAESVGYASNMKEFKQNPGAYEGNVGDVSMVLRLAITGRQQSPDLQEVMQILGKNRIEQRLSLMLKTL